MKGFIDTIRNIWHIEDLRARILTTLGFILIYRVGSYIALPGINPGELEALQQQGQQGMIAIINIFAGGAFSRASIFALGIMPYISASIVIQLLTLAVPYFQKLQKEGESGRRQINQITRFLTVVITLFQSAGYIANLYYTSGGAIEISQTLFYLSSAVCLTAGTIFVMWMGERITEKGIGNGISLLIMIGIVANLPLALVNELANRTEGGQGGLIPFVLELAGLVFVVIAVILLVQGTRRIPVQYAKRVVGNRQYGGVRQYIPLKINAAGVMPIIFAQALMMIPATLAQFANIDAGSWYNDPTSFWYSTLNFLMVVLFTYFYTALIVNPVQMADEMKKNGGFIPGVKPGRKTAEYIDTIMSRITLPGALFLGFVAVLPGIVASLFKMNMQFAYFYGGTSLLIMVAVILDTLQQIESHLLMRHYDGLMKSGRIKGRGTASAATGVTVQQG